MMSYPSDLTEVEWKKIKHPFEPCERRVNSCKHPRKKDVVDVILYVVRTGCQGRQLPNGLSA
jgi:transposase